MTVSTTVSSVSYVGTGATASWPVPFKVFDKAHLVVTVDGVEISAAAFGFSGAGNETGTVTYPLSGSLATGAEILIERIVPLKQETTLDNQGGFFPEAVENALDRLTMADQQLHSSLGELIASPAVFMLETGPEVGIGDTAAEDATSLIQALIDDPTVKVIRGAPGVFHHVSNLTCTRSDIEWDIGLQQILGSAGATLTITGEQVGAATTLAVNAAVGADAIELASVADAEAGRFLTMRWTDAGTGHAYAFTSRIESKAGGVVWVSDPLPAAVQAAWTPSVIFWDGVAGHSGVIRVRGQATLPICRGFMYLSGDEAQGATVLDVDATPDNIVVGSVLAFDVDDPGFAGTADAPYRRWTATVTAFTPGVGGTITIDPALPYAIDSSWYHTIRVFDPDADLPLTGGAGVHLRFAETNTDLRVDVQDIPWASGFFAEYGYKNTFRYTGRRSGSAAYSDLYTLYQGRPLWQDVLSEQAAGFGPQDRQSYGGVYIAPRSLSAGAGRGLKFSGVIDATIMAPVATNAAFTGLAISDGSLRPVIIAGTATNAGHGDNRGVGSALWIVGSLDGRVYGFIGSNSTSHDCYVSPDSTGWRIFDCTFGANKVENLGGAVIEGLRPRLALIATDAPVTLNMFSGEDVVHSGTLTADRTITLPASNAYLGAQFRFYRSGGGGAFRLDIGGLCKLGPGQSCAVEWNGSAWILTRAPSVGSWINYTPTLTASVGTITPGPTSGSRYRWIGSDIEIEPILGSGNAFSAGSGELQFALPVPNTGESKFGFGANASTSWGVVLKANGGGTTVSIRRASDASYPVTADGQYIGGVVRYTP